MKRFIHSTKIAYKSGTVRMHYAVYDKEGTLVSSDVEERSYNHDLPPLMCICNLTEEVDNANKYIDNANKYNRLASNFIYRIEKFEIIPLE